MNDNADPHSSRRVREPDLAPRRGAYAAWIIDGNAGLARTR
ncbi:MAG: hypothetical protein ACRDNS_02480 [Trebonia sp.]